MPWVARGDMDRCGVVLPATKFPGYEGVTEDSAGGVFDDLAQFVPVRR